MRLLHKILHKVLHKVLHNTLHKTLHKALLIIISASPPTVIYHLKILPLHTEKQTRKVETSTQMARSPVDQTPTMTEQGTRSTRGTMNTTPTILFTLALLQSTRRLHRMYTRFTSLRVRYLSICMSTGRWFSPLLTPPQDKICIGLI